MGRREISQAQMKGPMQAHWFAENPDKYGPKNPRQALRLAVVKSYLPPLSKNARILEVGCNQGQNLSFLQKEGFTKLYGVELNPRAIEVAAANELDAQITQLDIETDALPFVDGFFDYVFTFGCLMHIYNDLILREIARVARTWISTVEAEATDSPTFIERNYHTAFPGFIEVKNGTCEWGMCRVFKKEEK